MATVATVGATGNADIDGLLGGLRWSGVLSYSFTDHASDYNAGYGYGEPTAAGFAQISASQQAAVHSVMGLVGQYTNLAIQFAGTDGADIRIAQSSAANPTAYAFYPGGNEGGDIWFGTSYSYREPKLGDYYYATHIHELGHALGLKHSQETGGVANVPVPAGHDALEYTVMSYRSYVGGPTNGYTNETYGFPTTYMMNDIRALQEMYGADFTTNSGDTVYKWSPITGEFSINGAGQGQPGGAGAPASANVVFMTVWDGGGNDTYDFSNYTTALTVDLNPGAASTMSATQIAYLGNGQSAHGSVYNAYLYNGDARSYIENVTGGSAGDTLSGNATANRIDGGAGNDTLAGGAGSDVFVFRSGYGTDIVVDYSVGFDRVDLTDFSAYDSFSDVMAVATQSGINALFAFGAGLSLTLANVAVTALSASDFFFAATGAVTDAPPSAITLGDAHIAENLAGGVVAALTVSDADDSAFTFAVSDGRFEVGGTAGAYVLKLKAGIALDYESEPGVQLSVTATDGDGLSVTKAFSLIVDDAGGVTITGTSARDIIDGTRTVKGQLKPTSEADVINAGGGDDTVYALAGNDWIEGGAGNDTLYGDAGNDRISGGTGLDRIYGGAGDDTFVISEGDGQTDVFSGGDGIDTLQVIGYGSAILGKFSATTASVEAWLGNGQAVLGTASADTLDFSGLQSSSGIAYFDAGAGNDALGGTRWADDLRGGAGNDSIYGHDGADRITGGIGADMLDAGAGDDTFVFGGTDGNGDVMRGGAGYDTVEITGPGAVTLARFDAANGIEAWQGNGAGVVGTSAADVLDFSGLVDVARLGVVEGGAGNDRIVGSWGNDDLRGGGGDDALTGGLGNDMLRGGEGKDRYIFAAGFGHDTIVGFQGGAAAGDVIQMSKALFVNVASVMAAAHQVGAHVVITAGPTDSLTLQNTLLSSLHGNDFTFL